ncbi:hypothetical protein P5673_017247 [Acropora cervicornis]|uniref:Uncharacterized protein n=1 Tax=Acropora cervicornis TaxID=6130 RepID=A0AAD9QFL0_ACRCE|nr:hypothetical protein P5673_017247 [Acropora cervicornis]
MKDAKDSFTDPSQSVSERKVKTRTFLAFFAIGFLVDFFFVANLSSSQDILQGTEIPTSFVFLSSNALTTLVCLSPEVTHLLLALLWILFPIAYKAMDGLSDKIRQKSHPTSHTEVPYSPLEVDKDEVQSKLLRADMTTLVWKSQVPFMALFTSNFSAQLLVGGVVTTLAFDKTPVAPRSQYIFYMLALGFGDFLGRSYLGILSTCGVQSKFRIKKNMDSRTWKFIFTCMHVLVSAFVFGAVFVNSFHNAGEGLTVSEKRFCRALMTGAAWSANTAVALIGWDTEVKLRRRCLAFNPEVVCYTRSLTKWNPSEHCVSYQ